MRRQLVSSASCSRGPPLQAHLKDKLLIDVPLGDVRVEVGAFDKAEEELVDDLEVRPGKLEHGFVLLWVVRISCRVHGRRDRSEEVGSELVDRAASACLQMGEEAEAAARRTMATTSG